MEELVERLEDDLLIQQRQIKTQFEILKAFSDLYVEMTEETDKRKWLQRIIAKHEREAARIKLDLWFWRPEQSLPIEQQLSKRANYLLSITYSVDDLWDLLTEYLQDWVGIEVDEGMLRDVIAGATDASAH